MELRTIDAAGVVLHLAPYDCANLGRLCELGEGQLITPEEAPLAETGRTFAALFRALAVAGIAPSCMVPRDWQSLADELADLGLAGLLQLSGLKAQEVTE